MRLAFYKATRPGLAGLYNRAVRSIDGGPYSHAELMFSDGVCASSSWMDGGVRFKVFEPSADKWDIVDLADHFDERQARGWFEQHAGARYDLAGNLKFIWHWWPASKSRWFCTSAIAAALALPPAKKPWWYGPRKLHAALAAAATPTSTTGGFQ